MRALRTPLGVAAAVLAAYVVWAVWFAAHHSPAELARVGSDFQGRDAGSPEIDALGDAVVDAVGYDGQFFLFIALDPRDAEGYVDEPAYRYSRIVYPLVARAVGLGLEDAIPWALLLVNLLAVGAGTLAVALLLRGRGLSPWYAALFGLYPGVFVAVSRDLSEPLAYALAAGALLAFERRRVPAAALLFALAGLTRETTLLFPASLAVWLAATRRMRDAAILAATVVPYAALRFGLWLWLGTGNDARAQALSPLPFGGLVEQRPWSELTVEQLYAVVAPSLLALGLALAVRVRRRELAVLGANVLVLVVLLPEPSWAEYAASGRIATGVMLAFLLCLPALARAGRLTQAWIAAVLWLSPWYALLPEAFARSP